MRPTDHDVIDSHHHLWPAAAMGDQAWRPERDEAIRRAFEPDDLRPDLTAAGVTGTVLMQSVDSTDENDRLFAYADAADFVRGVVAWAPLPRPADALRVVDGLLEERQGSGAARPVGVRCLVGADPMEWALTDAGLTTFRRLAAAGLAWDTVPITPAQVDTVVQVAQRVPELRIVVDHLASPPLTDDGWAGWSDRAGRLAAQDGVAIKLSVGVAVLDRWSSWDAAALRPYVLRALEAFGPARSMLASNWPVVLLRASYGQAWRDVEAVVADGLSPDELHAVRAATARTWYGMGER